jgi:hypothetical protein
LQGAQLKLLAFHELNVCEVYPQVQLQLFIDPVNTLVVPFEALQVAHIQIAKAKAPVAVVVRQIDQPS